MIETSRDSHATTAGPVSESAVRPLELCRRAKELEDLGDYEKGREALSALWREPGSEPQTTGLTIADQAELLLRAGTLTGWIGDSKQIKDHQEKAKNLISRSLEIYKTLDQPLKVAECEAELAYCYWRTGEYDEARIMLEEAHRKLDREDHTELLAITKIRQAIVEASANRHQTALEIIAEARPLVERIDNDCLRGKYHVNLAIILRRAGKAEKRGDLEDRALIEYAAASHYFEAAGHKVYRAAVEGNLGYLFYSKSNYDEAQQHLETAHLLFTELGDHLHAAQINETRARTHIAQENYAAAKRLAFEAVTALKQGDSKALLAEAQTTLGTAQARLKQTSAARATLLSAARTALEVSDTEAAALAYLTIIEELEGELTPTELRRAYDQAEELTASSPNPDIQNRLSRCARLIIQAMRRHTGGGGPTASPAPEATPTRSTSATSNFLLPPTPDEDFNWADFSLEEQTRLYQRPWILRALRESNKKVTPAARLLGFKHPNSLNSLIESRHRDLMTERNAAVPRRKNLTRKQ